MVQPLHSVLSNCSLRLKLCAPCDLIISLRKIYPRETLSFVYIYIYINFYCVIICSSEKGKTIFPPVEIKCCRWVSVF